MKQELSINDRLKDLRTNKHLHLDELSSETGIPKATLGNYEQDDYPVPHPIVIQLAKYYGVSTDYLLGITDNPVTSNTPISELHFSDTTIEKLRGDDMNSRLLSEIIENEDFRQFLIDAEVYVDGYVEQAIEDYNFLMETGRKKVSENYHDTKDNTSEALVHSRIAQQEYFSHVFADDLIRILDTIKEKHKDDRETSDGSFTAKQYEQISQAILEHRSGPLKGLGAGILEALRIKKNASNLHEADTLLSGDHPDEATATDLLGQSPIVEPDARKRRKR